MIASPSPASESGVIPPAAPSVPEEQSPATQPAQQQVPPAIPPLDPLFGRGTTWDAMREAQITRCYETAVHLCPNALGATPQVLMRCTERAIRAGNLEEECLVILRSVDLDTLQLREIGGVFGTAPDSIPLENNQLACVDELLHTCKAATNRWQLKRCATISVREGNVRAQCLAYLFD